jgi:hypothetical protein
MTNQKSEVGLYEVLEAELRKSNEPLDCATLFERPSVREHAATINRVSDYLGNFWRKGLVLRLPAPRLEGTKARWMYVWKDKGPKKRPKPDMSQAIEYTPQLDKLISKPNLDISDDGKTINIVTPYLTITIQTRSDD